MDGHRLRHDRLHAFTQQVLSDLNAGYNGLLASLGAKLGLYQAMANAGPLSAWEVAGRARCAEPYVQAWLDAQAAVGYVTYHAVSDTYELEPEQAAVLAHEEGPACMTSAWAAPAAMWTDEGRLLEVFRSGSGLAWNERHEALAGALQVVRRHRYRASLLSEWLRALPDVLSRLEAGMEVADIGCGEGHATVLMAQAFPHSRFHGFDPHEASIGRALRCAEASGLGGRLRFGRSRADDYPGRGYGLVCFLHSLHYLGDPARALAHAAATLGPGGSVMLVEPVTREDTRGGPPAAQRLHYAESCLVSCAHALSEGSGQVIGARPDPLRLERLFRRAGFGQFRRAAAVASGTVYEARR